MPLAHQPPTRQAGFSLIFVSILLTVAALVFVSVLPGQEAGSFTQKTSNSSKKLERVEEAMRSFMAFNGRRPCPADGQYAENTANFGLEAGIPGACTGGSPVAPLGPDVGTGRVVGGVIPTKSLGLPDDYAFDEFGRQFTYVVDKRATGKNSCIALEGLSLTNTIPTGIGGVVIKNTATAGTIIDQTMYAYISHGASGYGAYPAQGAPDPAHRINSGSTDADMQTNAGVDSSFNYSTANFTNVFVQKDRVAPVSGGDTGFDDLVWYRPDIKNICCLGPSCVPIGFKIDGAYDNANLGIGQVLFADVNGDGKPDLIMVAKKDPTGSYARIYVIFGQNSSFVWPDPLNVSTLDGTNGFAITVDQGGGVGIMPMDFIGHHDGTMDLVVSAWRTNGYCGGSTILFGQKAPAVWPASFNLSTLKADGSTNPKGMQINDCANNFAHGDINDDGINDLVFGAGWAWGDYYQSGRTYVIFGTPTPPNSLDLNTLTPGIPITSASYATYTSPPFTVTAGSHTLGFKGMYAGPNYVWSAIDNVAINGSATQFTDPGFETPALGGGTLTYCPVGSAWTFSTLDCTGSDTAAGLVGNGGSWGPCAPPPNATQGVQAAFIAGGSSISQAVNLAAGTYTISFDAASGNCGYYDNIAITVDGVIVNNTNTGQGFVIQGNLSWENLGSSVATGDFNGDGIKDILIGGSDFRNGSNSGSFIVWGHPAGYVWPALLDVGSPIFTSTGTLATSTGVWINKSGGGVGSYFGGSVLGFDFNGDGTDDLLIYAYGSICFGGGGGPGSWWVIYGQPIASWNSRSFDITTINGTNGAYFGCSYGAGISFSNGSVYSTVSAVADFNGDSKPDFATLMNAPSIGDGVAMYYNLNSQTSHVWWPAASTPTAEINGSNGYIFNVSQPTAIAAGDVNHDGTSDVVVGVPGTAPNGANSGEVYVIYGSSSAFPNNGVITPSYFNGTTGFAIPGVNAGDQLGTTVTSGDINNDGKTDLVLCAPYASPNDGAQGGGNQAGSCYVLWGKTKWQATTPLNGL